MFALRLSHQDDFEFLWHLHKTTMQGYVEQTWGEWQDEAQANRLRENFGVVWQPQIILVEDERVGAVCVEQKRESLFISSLNILPKYQSASVDEC